MSLTDQQKRLQVVNSVNPSLRSVAIPKANLGPLLTAQSPVTIGSLKVSNPAASPSFRGVNPGPTPQAQQPFMQQVRQINRPQQAQPAAPAYQPPPSFIPQTKSLAPTSTFLQNNPNASLTPNSNGGNLIKSAANLSTASFKPFATGIARVLPGGQNDIKAQNEAIDAMNATRHFIMNNDKLSWEQKSNLLRSMKGDQENLSKQIDETRKSIPTRTQVIASALQVASAPFLGAANLGRNIVEKTALATAEGQGLGLTNELALNAKPTWKGAATNAGIGGAAGAIPLVGSAVRAASSKLFTPAEQRVIQEAGIDTGERLAEGEGQLAREPIETPPVTPTEPVSTPQVPPIKQPVFPKATRLEKVPQAGDKSTTPVSGKNPTFTAEEVAYLKKNNISPEITQNAEVTTPAAQTTTPKEQVAQAVEGQTAKEPAVAPEQQVAQEAVAQQAASGSTLPAVTKMSDVLNTGGTVDEALNQYMLETGSNIGEAKVALQKLLKDKGVDRGSINASLNPKYDQVSIAPVSKGNSEQAILNSRTIRNDVIKHGNKALAAVDKLSENDHRLIDNVRSVPVEDLAAQADDPAAFTEAAQAVKDYNDYTHAAGSGLLGQDVPYRQNYGAPLFFDQSPEGQAALDTAQKAALKGSPSYAKSRTFKDYNEAASYGAQRLHQNFSQDLAHDISRRSNDLSQLTLHQGLEEAHPGQVKVGEIGSTPEGTYSQLQIPGGQKISLPKPLADQINRRAQPSDSQGFVKGYDTVNRGLKYVKLGGGAFHALTEAGNFIGQQLVSGKLFTEPGSAGKVFKTFFSSQAMDREMAALESKGVVRNADLAGLVRTPEGILADANVSVGGKAAKYSGIKGLHDATFQREIPYAKLKTFEQQTQGLNFNNPQDVAQARAIAKEINQNYGGINRAVEGLTPKTFKSASRFVLATDFTEGKIRTLADALSKGGPEGKLARQIVAGKALLFGGLATAGGAVAGEYKGKSPQDVARTILEKFADPKFTAGDNSVALPATHVSEFTRPFESFFNGTKDKFSGIKHYATGRLAAVPSEVNQLANNLDYTGNHIYGKNTKRNGGQPFTPLQTAANVASGFSPIPVSQGIGVGSGKTSPAAAVANTIGLRVTPSTAKLAAGEVPLTDAQNQPILDAKGQPATVVIPKGVTGVSKDVLVQDARNRAAADSIKAGLSPNEKVLYGQSDSSLKSLLNQNKISQDTYDQIQAYKQVASNVTRAPAVLPKTLDSNVKDYINSTSTLTDKGRENWAKNAKGQALSQKVANELNKQLPKGIDALPATPELLDAYAKFDKARADAAANKDPRKQWDEIVTRGKLRDFWKSAVEVSQPKDVKEVYGLSMTQLKDYFLANKKVSADQLKAAVSLNDRLLAADLSDTNKYSAKFRATFGLPDAPEIGSGTGGGSSGSGSGGTNKYGAVRIKNADGTYSYVDPNTGLDPSKGLGLSQLVPSNLSFSQPNIDTTPTKKTFKINLPSDVTGRPKPQRVVSTRAKRARIL